MSDAEPTPSPPPQSLPPPGPPAAPPRRGSLWLGVLLLLAGAVWLLSLSDVIDVGLEAGIGLVLIGIGAVLALDAGRSHGVLVTLAVLLSLLGATTTLVDVDILDGDVGDRTVAPTSVADASAGHELAVGQLTLDLTGVPGGADDPVVPVEASVGIGQLDVVVAADAAVEVDAHVGVGNIDTLGEAHDGFDLDDHSELPGPGRRIELDASVGIGELVITRAP